LSRFGQQGIGPERLELRGRTPQLKSHLEQYHEVDIALDTFPYHGTTTTCEALLMGVPVISLAGQTHVQRVAVSLMNTIQMGELLAETEEQYVRRAVDLANDLDSLKEIRAEMRGWLKDSPLTDGKLFATNMEHAFRKMWLRWCSPQA
jgi:predicted O-linked N-acetylglucosamine transferase (SPINDLY family)